MTFFFQKEKASEAYVGTAVASALDHLVDVWSAKNSKIKTGELSPIFHTVVKGRKKKDSDTESEEEEEEEKKKQKASQKKIK